MINCHYFCLLDGDRNFIATDIDSGGYPYPVKEFKHARLWDSVDDIKKYVNMFKDRGYTIGKVYVSINERQ